MTTKLKRRRSRNCQSTTHAPSDASRVTLPSTGQAGDGTALVIGEETVRFVRLLRIRFLYGIWSFNYLLLGLFSALLHPILFPQGGLFRISYFFLFYFLWWWWRRRRINWRSPFVLFSGHQSDGNFRGICPVFLPLLNLFGTSKPALKVCLVFFLLQRVACALRFVPRGRQLFVFVISLPFCHFLLI